MKSIVLINCYFGKYPNYFNLFLDSCKKNPTINYLLFTDNVLSNTPENVTVVNTTFDEIKATIQNKFDFEISLDAPYKLCDYKPTYGYVFDEYLSEYDYWGYCDIDMIFGDLRKFLPENILMNYDKFYKLGHLTIFRNTPEINTLFMDEKVVSYRDAFTTKKIAVFDEFEGIQKIFDNQMKKTYFSRDYADITKVKNKFALSAVLAEDIQNNNYDNQLFVYQDGCVYRYFENENVISRDEFAYIHLQKRKFENTIQEGGNYFVTYHGFIPFDDLDITTDRFNELNGVDVWKEFIAKYKLYSFKIKRKIDKTRLCIYEHLTSSVNR